MTKCYSLQLRTMMMDVKSSRTESNGPNFTSASHGVRQEASLPSSQSLFTARFSKKLDGKNTNSRTVEAFESELSVLGRCDRGKIQYKGKPMTTLSSRQSPFQCPTNLSVDGDKRVRLNYRQNGGHFSTGSPHISEGKVSGFVSKKRKPSQVMSSNNVRPRNGREKCEVSSHGWDLASEIQWGVLNCRSTSIQATTFKLCLSTSIYYLWRERNSRIFRQVGNVSSSVVALIMGEIRACACSWRRMVKSPGNSRFCARWGFPESVFNSV